MTAYERPIPICERAPTSGHYHDVPLDTNDPRYSEALVDARDYGIAGENYYARTDGQNAPYHRPMTGAVEALWCQQSIAAMLKEVNARLAQYGAELYLFDAYRPVACQHALWDFFWTRFRTSMPQADDTTLVAQVRRYVSDPRQFHPENPHTWPTHATGAAVDLTLRDRVTGELLDMGTHFDDMSASSHSDYFERLLNHGRIAPEDHRLRNRRLLHWCMQEQGFTNYSYEYWHFDFGDQMYVMMHNYLGRDCPRAAWYGYISAPSRV